MEVEAKKVIERELEEGELVLWSGQPRKGIVFRSSDLYMIPFSLMWRGFAIFWEVMVLRQAQRHGSPGLVFELWGIPFVLMGLYLIFGRFLIDALQRENTYYGVTDHRVVIVAGLLQRRMSPNLATLICLVLGYAHRKVKSLDLATLSDVSMNESADGSGTITFGAQVPYSFAFGNAWPGINSGPKFDLIADVKSVYQQIRNAQRRAH